MLETRPRTRLALAAASAAALLGTLEAAQVFAGLTALGESVTPALALRLTIPSWAMLLLLAVPLLWWLESGARAGPGGRRVPVIAAVGVAFVLLHLAGTAVLDELLAPDPVGTGTRFVQLASIYFVADGLAYLAIVGMHGVASRARARARRAVRAAHARAEHSESRRTTLEERFRPDFFFNTLNAVSGSLARDDVRTASILVDSLGELVRAALGRSVAHSTVRDELQLVGHLLTIQSTRFPGRVRGRVHAGEGTGGRMVPPLLLVPVVEQLIEQGLGSRHPFHIDVRTHLSGASVDVTIEQPAGVPEAVGELLHRRLDALGNGARCRIEADGSLVIHLPPTPRPSTTERSHE